MSKLDPRDRPYKHSKLTSEIVGEDNAVVVHDPDNSDAWISGFVEVSR